MKLTKRLMALSAVVLAVCLLLTACSSRQENIGVSNDKKMVIAAAEDLSGKAVGVQLRSAADDFVVNHQLTDFPKRYENLENAAQDLADKKLAAIVTDANYAKKLTAEVEGLQIVDGSIGSIDYRFLLKKSDEANAYVKLMNEKIQALRESDTGEYANMVQTELVKGERYTLEQTDVDAFQSVTFAAEPYFKPFAYESDGALQGFFVTMASRIGYDCGWNVKPLSVKPNGAEEAVQNADIGFCVTDHEVDDEGYLTTNAFYTSDLVIVIRSENAAKSE